MAIIVHLFYCSRWYCCLLAWLCVNAEPNTERQPQRRLDNISVSKFLQSITFQPLTSSYYNCYICTDEYLSQFCKVRTRCLIGNTPKFLCQQCTSKRSSITTFRISGILEGISLANSQDPSFLIWRLQWRGMQRYASHTARPSPAALRVTQKYVQRIAPCVGLGQVTALVPVAIPNVYGGRNVQDILTSGVRRWQPSEARLLLPHL